MVSYNTSNIHSLLTLNTWETKISPAKMTN